MIYILIGFFEVYIQKSTQLIDGHLYELLQNDCTQVTATQVKIQTIISSAAAAPAGPPNQCLFIAPKGNHYPDL